MIAAADVFTIEVWTWQGLVTSSRCSSSTSPRRVHVLGSAPHPSALFMDQVSRSVTAADDGVLPGHCVLICDRDRKWSRAVRRRGPDAGAGAERECVRYVPLAPSQDTRDAIRDAAMMLASDT